MSSSTSGRFPGVYRVLFCGKSKKGKKNTRKAGVIVSIVEGRFSRKGHIGLAAIDLSTMDFHIFTFETSSAYTLLKLQLQALQPAEVIICESVKQGQAPNADLLDALKAVGDHATVSIVQERCFEGMRGREFYRNLRDLRDTELFHLSQKDLCLSAFAGLVLYTEHVRGSPLPAHACRLRFHDDAVACPLCELADPEAGDKAVKLTTVKELQDHFFRNHWVVHGYACHHCGVMFPTPGDLANNHQADCQEFADWKAAREGGGDQQLKMSCARMLLCCSDCGWYAPLSRSGDEAREETTLRRLKAFFAHHHNDGLLSMVVYFPAEPTAELKSVRFPITSFTGGNPLAPCAHCDPPVQFRDPSEANEHYTKEHKDKALVCEECSAVTKTAYLLGQHQMEHVHDNAYFADFLTNSARVFPPPLAMKQIPRNGWRHRARSGRNCTYGGLPGVTTQSEGYDPVNPHEHLAQRKIRLGRQRRSDKQAMNIRGYEHAKMQHESYMASVVREKLMSKFGDCAGISGIDDKVWLKDADARMFQEWMDGWESEEGKQLGGPPKKIEIDLTPMIIRIPTVEVELKFADSDFISGFLLNDKVFYCNECDGILKGQEQAEEHLNPERENGETNYCALSEGVVNENPMENKNLVLLYSLDSLASASTATASSSLSLRCPHCPHVTCSITGLRVHVMGRHGVLAKYVKTQGERVSSTSALRLDIGARRAQAAALQAALMPPPKRVPPRKRPPPNQDPVDVEVDFILKRVLFQVVQSDESRKRREAALEDGVVVPVVDLQGDDDVTMVEETTDEQEVFRDEAVGASEADDRLLVEADFREIKMEEPDEDDEVQAVLAKPVIREITPTSDDELCVVAEVKNAGCEAAALTIMKQKEKKFACDKCSLKFLKQSSLTNHMTTGHNFDAAKTTIVEELGIPLATQLWLCRNCCVAFPTLESKREHARHHGKEKHVCDTCSGCAYSAEVIANHRAKVAAKKVEYVCGQCRLSYDKETCLHEHSKSKHGTHLFYFCKSCELGSTSGADVYKHFMMDWNCPIGYQTLRKTAGAEAQESAWQSIGVCPAGQLHFQPTDVEYYKRELGAQPNRFVKPSTCNHRSFMVASEVHMTCDTCRCLENYQTREAREQFANGSFDKRWYRAANTQPLSTVRREYMARHTGRAASMTARTTLSSSKYMPQAGLNGHAPPFVPPVGDYRILATTARPTLHVDTLRPAQPSLHQQLTQGVQLQPLPAASAHHTTPTHDVQEAQGRFYDRMDAVRVAREGGAAGGSRSVSGTPAPTTVAAAVEAGGRRGEGVGDAMKAGPSTAPPRRTMMSWAASNNLLGRSAMASSAVTPPPAHHSSTMTSSGDGASASSGAAPQPTVPSTSSSPSDSPHPFGPSTLKSWP